MVSQYYREQLFAQETDEALLTLLTITHSDLPEPIRVVNNMEDIVSNGNTFLACAFKLQKPQQDTQIPPAARLSIDNVSREIVLAVRSISTPPGVKFEVVLSSDPDTIEGSFDDFFMDNVNYDAAEVTADLRVTSFVHEPYPAHTFTPSRFPGGF